MNIRDKPVKIPQFTWFNGVLSEKHEERRVRFEFELLERNYDEHFTYSIQ